MKSLYETYPRLTVEKIGTKNTPFYINIRFSCNDESDRFCNRALAEITGTPYRITDGKTTLTLYIHKVYQFSGNGERKAINSYVITEESTGMALWNADTFKQAVKYLTGDLDELQAAGGDIRDNIAYKWDCLKKLRDQALTGDFDIRHGIEYAVLNAAGEIKTIEDYPAEIQERYFKLALTVKAAREKENARKAKKETAPATETVNTAKNARKQPVKEKKPEGVYNNTPETVKCEIEDLKAKIDRHYAAALEKWRAAHNLKPATA